MDYWNDSDGGYLGFWGETEVEMKCTIVLYFSFPIFGSNSRGRGAPSAPLLPF